ncbi:MAG: hypothetical protein FWD66_03850 [Paludibacter sp.]|nr:hypothetical protein [Paludibacter sp.]
MISLVKNICVFFFFLFWVSQINGQNTNKLYLGFGSGFDYGAIVGTKIEYLPIKHLGIFGGLGCNVISICWNAGGTYKFLPDNRVSPNLMLFYGYNGAGYVLYGSRIPVTSYGLTVGSNIDFKIGHTGNKISVGLLVPIRSKKIMDKYNALKEDPGHGLFVPILPIGITVGFNFKLI